MKMWYVHGMFTEGLVLERLAKCMMVDVNVRECDEYGHSAARDRIPNGQNSQG